MEFIEIVDGSRKVIATRNDETCRWSARLYVNNGETATNVSAQQRFVTERSVRQWAAKVLPRD